MKASWNKIIIKVKNIYKWKINKDKYKYILQKIDACLWSIFLGSLLVLIIYTSNTIKDGIRMVLVGCHFGGVSLWDKMYSLCCTLKILYPYGIICSALGLLVKKIIIESVNFYFNKIADKQDKGVTFKDRIFSYINYEGENKRCLIITGEWGKGKTYQLNRALQEYCKYRTVNYYVVSCFAIESRNQLMELLLEEVKSKDRSYGKSVVQLLNCIPVLGNILALGYEQKYKVGSLHRKDIIVLEDIERVAWNMESSETAQGLNIVAGFANEMIERYNKKVILVCDDSKIKKEIYDDLFVSKLSHEIISVPDPSIFYELIVELENDFSHETVSVIKKILERNIVELEKIFVQAAENRNIRCRQRLIRDIALFVKKANLSLENYNNPLKESGEIIARSVYGDYIFSLAIYELFSELHMQKNLCEETTNFVQLCMENEHLRKNSTCRRILFSMPTNQYWIGIERVNAVIGKSNGLVIQSDIWNNEQPYMERADINKWNKIVIGDIDSITYISGIDSVLFTYAYVVTKWSGAAVDTIKDYLKDNEVEQEEYIPVLISIINACEVLDRESIIEFMEIIQDLLKSFEELNTNGYDMLECNIWEDHEFKKEYERMKDIVIEKDCLEYFKLYSRNE